MIILSISIQSIDDIAILTAAIESCLAGGIPPIAHVGGLPRLASVLGGTASSSEVDHGAATIAALRDLIAESDVPVWAGGWSGLTQRFLSDEELEWDLTWSVTNPWDTGLTRLLGKPPECIFPIQITGAQAEALTRSRIAKKHPLCLGYASSIPLAPIVAVPVDGDPTLVASSASVSTPGRLHVGEKGRWSVLPTERLNAGLIDAVDCPEAHVLHAVLSATSIGRLTPCRDELSHADWRARLVDPATTTSGAAASGAAASGAPLSDAPPSGTAPGTELAPVSAYFTCGLPEPRWADPVIMAERARMRAARRPSRDRTRAILAADPEAPTPRGKASPDLFRNRELQGSVTGSLRLDTDTVGAVLSEGRMAGLTIAGAPLTPPIRSQGFVQTPDTVSYLSTVDAAWFTGINVRGVHETASLGDAVSVATTLFAHDDVPGITLTMRVSVSDRLPSDAIRVALMETVIAELPSATGGSRPGESESSAGINGAIVGFDGAVRECHIAPSAADRYPWEWTRDAVAVRIDLAAASIWVAAAHPRATVTAPFAFGVRPAQSGPQLVWYPLGFATDRDDTLFQPGSWTVSYRITADDAPLLRVEDLVATEIDGFSASPLQAIRSRTTLGR